MSATADQLALFDPPGRPHPCPYPRITLRVFDAVLPRVGLVLDPFGGKGGIHRIATATRDTVAVELEPEWAIGPRTIHGDATALPFTDNTFDAIATSPSYGNRFADQSVRPDADTHSYAHSLGRRCSAGSGAAMQWGDEYRALHARAITEMVRVVRPGGLLLVNMKNHRRKGREQKVVEWWRDTLRDAGARDVETIEVDSGGIRHGANQTPMPEYVLVHEVTP